MEVACNNCDKIRALSSKNKEAIIENFGSEEKAKAGYLCRTCKKEAREEREEEEKKEKAEAKAEAKEKAKEEKKE